MNDAIVQENWRMKGNRHLRENRHLKENRPLQASPMHTVVIVLVQMYLCLKLYLPLFLHSFIPDIYIAPLQETYSESLSVQLRSKRNALRILQKEDTLLRGSKQQQL